MSRRAPGWTWVPFLALALLSLAADPGLVRDGDQGAMLAGALRLAEGDALVRPGYYAYDRSWLAYLLTAGGFRLMGAWARVSAVPAANIATRVLFWGAWALFLDRVARRTSARLAAWCVLATPAAVLASVYWNATALSSAFVALGAVALARRSRAGTGIGILCFGVATGIRVDVVLLAPLLLWALSPRMATMGTAGRRGLGAGVGVAMAMAAAGLTGRLLAGGGARVSDLFFSPRVVLGYMVFGAGGILLATLVLLATRPGRQRSWDWAIGLGALLLPMMFYLPQLHTPRYLLRAGEAVLLLAVAPRGRRWLGRAFGGPRRLWGAALAAAVAVPLGVGLHLPSPVRPRLTWREPTLMPSGDGFMPMGALLGFGLRLRQAARVPVDHNQVLWNALEQTDFSGLREGPWPVLASPQIGLFDLQAAQAGRRLETVAIAASGEREGFLAETRMLARSDAKQPAYDAAARLLLDRPAVERSPAIEGIAIVEIGAGDTEWSREIRLLRRLFEGAEYRVRPSAAERARDEGRTVVFYSDAAFEVTETHPGALLAQWASTWDEATGLHAVRRPGARREVVRQVTAAHEVRRAVRVHPDWMVLP